MKLLSLLRGGTAYSFALPALLFVTGCTLAPKLEEPLVDAQLHARIGTVESEISGVKAAVDTIQGDVSGIKANTSGSFNINGNPISGTVAIISLAVSHLAALFLPSPLKRKTK